MRYRVWLLLPALLAGCSQQAPSPPAPGPEPVRADGLDNVYRVGPGLYSGSSPEGDEGFRFLRDLGVRTVLTVDGARPEADQARKFGLRYVHIPVGYDGISHEKGLLLARAVRDLPRPIYVHCHHGKHRGPAAVAVALRCLDGKFTPEDALSWLRTAGTDPHYAGLYASPGRFRPLAPEELEGVPADFPETAAVPALAEAMVGIDQRWDGLKLIRKAGWKAPAGHPDLDPAHEALLLAEAYREAARQPGLAGELRRGLANASEGARELESALRSGKGPPAAEAGYARAEAACAGCHGRFRDNAAKP